MQLNDTGTLIVGAALKVHSLLGPGLLEGAYAQCLAYELTGRGARVEREAAIAIRCEGLFVEKGYRADMIVNGAVLLELKAIERILPVHGSQLLSYLRLGGYKPGYLLNFHTAHMRDGIVRFASRL